MQLPIDKLANRVREAREEQHLSLNDLAEMLNMNSHTIMAFENGRSNPRIETVLMIAAALHISIDSVLYSGSARLNAVDVEVLDFFSGKGKEESGRYIRICREIEAITEGQDKD